MIKKKFFNIFLIISSITSSNLLLSAAAHDAEAAPQKADFPHKITVRTSPYIKSFLTKEGEEKIKDTDKSALKMFRDGLFVGNQAEIEFVTVYTQAQTLLREYKTEVNKKNEETKRDTPHLKPLKLVTFLRDNPQAKEETLRLRAELLRKTTAYNEYLEKKGRGQIRLLPADENNLPALYRAIKDQIIFEE